MDSGVCVRGVRLLTHDGTEECKHLLECSYTKKEKEKRKNEPGHLFDHSTTLLHTGSNYTIPTFYGKRGLFLSSVELAHLLAGAAVERVRGRVNALHLVENHALVRQRLVLVLQLVVPALLLHHLFRVG